MDPLSLHFSMPHFYAQLLNRLATERNSHDGNVQRQDAFYLRHAGVYSPCCDYTSVSLFVV